MRNTAINEEDTEETLRNKRETVTKLILRVSKIKTLFFEVYDKLRDEMI